MTLARFLIRPGVQIVRREIRSVARISGSSARFCVHPLVGQPDVEEDSMRQRRDGHGPEVRAKSAVHENRMKLGSSRYDKPCDSFRGDRP